MRPLARLWRCAALLTAASLTAISAVSAARAAGAPADWLGPWILPEDDFVVGVLREQNPNDPVAPALTAAYRSVLAAAQVRRITGIDPTGTGLRTNAESCRPPGMPDLMRYPVAIELLLSASRVTLISEEGPAVRRIYTDGRSHEPAAEPSYLGESIGHWEGATLVVDTSAISPKAQLVGPVHSSGRAHVVERLQLKDRWHLQIDTLVEDPLALQRPWRYTRVYRRLDSGFVESVCLDNNRDADGEPDLTPPKAPVAP